MSAPAAQQMDVVLVSARHHLHILRSAIHGLRRFAPVRNVCVITDHANFPQYRRFLASEVDLLDEDQMIPSMTLESLRSLVLPGFPKMAGWYYQQLLKFAFAIRPETTEHCLIWDADTVLLRPMPFLDNDGRAIFTVADEYHPPYFHNYRRLLELEPEREFSFISQHIVINKRVLSEMLERICSHVSGTEPWAWKIMRTLEGTNANLFSEYETYGHYVKTQHPERAVFRRLPWCREGSRVASYHPSRRDLERLACQYYFAAFERYQARTWHWLRIVRQKLINATAHW